MKVLITGATGYLGSCLAKRLHSRGHTIACTVRSFENLKRLECLRGDVTLIPTSALDEGVAEFSPETVIHTACTYSRGTYTEQEVFMGNLEFPFYLMQATINARVCRWINTATALPPTINSYALSKNQFVQWGETYARTGKNQFLNLVLEHFYGPDAPDEHFFSWIIRKLKRNEPVDLTLGTQKRDFIYIEDVLDVYEAALSFPMDEPYMEIGVGTGTTPTIREVVEYLKSIVFSDSVLNFGAVPMREGEPDSCCNTATMELLGLNEPLGWRDGMKLLVRGEKNK